MSNFETISSIKLCMISPSFPLPMESSYIGPDSAVHNLVCGLVEIDSDILIDIVTIQNGINKEFSSYLSPRIKVNYLPKRKFLSRSLGDPIVIKDFLKTHHYDLIHSHYPISLSNIMDLNIPKILTLHGIFHKEKKYVQNPLVGLCYHDYTTRMMKKILPKLDAFVAISPYVIDELKEIGLYEKMENIFQINNAIDNSFFELVPNSVKNNIFYPAGIRKLKNQMAAVEVVKLLKDLKVDFRLTLSGSSDKKYLKQIFSELEHSYCSNYVEYLGPVSRHEMLDLYSKASIVYLLSNQEVQPMVLLEAMAAGVPIIASNLKSISYLVEDNVNGYLVDPNDTKKIADYTIELLSSKDKRLAMGEAGRSIARHNYHAHKVAEKTLQMYREILSSKS